MTDIEVYKDASMTQRSVDDGYALLDTDGIDIDGRTGIHGFSIDTNDNPDGFYEVGHLYTVVVDAITVDGQTVRFVAGTFRLSEVEGSPGVAVVDAKYSNGVAWNDLVTRLNQIVGSVGNQVGSTGNDTTHVHFDEDGSYPDDAFNDCILLYTDASLGVTVVRWIIDYVGATSLATLDEALPGTPEAGVDEYRVVLLGRRRNVIPAADSITASVFATGAIDADAIANDAITAAKFDESTAFPLKSADAGSTQVARVGADGDTLETLSDQLDAVKVDTAATLADTGTDGVVVAAGSKTGYALSAAGIQAIWDALTSALTTVGSVGKLIVDNLNATVGSRASQTSVDDLPTNAELATALGTADDAVLTAIGALNDLDATEVQTAAAAALTAYDPPTKAELDTAQAAVIDGVLDAVRISKNTALSNFEFFMRDSADHVSGKTGLTVTAERSIDGGAFASCANAVSEVGSGVYKISLADTDLNGDVVTLRFSATGADDTVITLITQPRD